MFKASMPDGSIRSAEWAYAPQEKRAELERQLLDRTVSVWACDLKLGVLENLGSGFALGEAVPDNHSSSSSFALVATAAHVLEHSIGVLRPELDRIRFGPFAPPLVAQLRPLLEKQLLFVAQVQNTGYRIRYVGGVSINRASDLCILKAGDMPSHRGRARIQVMERPALPGPFPGRFVIDSDELAVGTTVMIAGYPAMHDNEQPQFEVTRAGRTITRQTTGGALQVRTGKIVAVHHRMRHVPAFGYETNIPMPPGMSGGPMFVLNFGGHVPLNVVGVCSSDATSLDTQADIGVAGCSFVVAAQNLYACPDPWTRVRDLTLPTAEIRPGRNTPFGNSFHDLGKQRDDLRLQLSRDAEGSLSVTRVAAVR